jgi:hypothetical protein
MAQTLSSFLYANKTAAIQQNSQQIKTKSKQLTNNPKKQTKVVSKTKTG